MLDKAKNVWYSTSCSAGVAHLVERHLAKVEVASSSLVARSKKITPRYCRGVIFFGFLPENRNAWTKHLQSAPRFGPRCARIMAGFCERMSVHFDRKCHRHPPVKCRGRADTRKTMRPWPACSGIPADRPHQNWSRIFIYRTGDDRFIILWKELFIYSASAESRISTIPGSAVSG